VRNNIKPLNSSQLKYHEDYNKNVKGKWCETPYFDIAIARMAMDNISDVSAINSTLFKKRCSDGIVQINIFIKVKHPHY